MDSDDGAEAVAKPGNKDIRHDLATFAAYSTELVRQTDRRSLADLLCINTLTLLELDALCLVVDDGTGGACLFTGELLQTKALCLPLVAALPNEPFVYSAARNLSTAEMHDLYSRIPELNARFTLAAEQVVAVAGIEADDGVKGFMLARRTLPHTFDTYDLQLLTEIARQVAYALKRIQIAEAQNRTARETQLMLQLSAELAAVSDMAVAATIVADQVRTLMNVAVSCLLIVNRISNKVEFSVFNGVYNSTVDATGITLPADYHTYWQSMPIISTSDYATSEWVRSSAVLDTIVAGEGVAALMAAPMTLGQYSYGILIVAERRRKTWSDDEQTAFVRFSRYIGNQLDNVWLYDEQRRHYAELERKNAQLTAAEARQLQLEATLRTTRGVSHILSQPLTVILGYAELLRQGESLSEEEMGIFEASVLRARDIMQRFNTMQGYSITDYDGQDSLVSFEDD